MMTSIIIPIYNSEKFLDECLASICRQSCRDFECILVNDGSTDSSEKICQFYCAKDTRFRLITQNNCGSAVARNTGLNYSNGEYIAFIDSDDYVETDFLKRLKYSLEKNDCDIAMCDLLIDGQRKHPEWSSLIMTRDVLFHNYLWGGD